MSAAKIKQAVTLGLTNKVEIEAHPEFHLPGQG